ncbi:ATP-NAD kinase family protein [Oceanibium sediminis]|uniref:ATP-NAD kinase family protein n=1 Tax=Oceanibium sediminis TaxID=2026339 RepID=UPI001E437C84|nr:ATP-NAD kinase family protein [Oceanibium sediminis]
MRIGLIVNPVAGLGGAVGLKGTDGPDTVAEALRRGANPQAGARTRLALERLAARCPGADLSVAPGPLGADWAEGSPLTLDIAHMPAASGTGRDTQLAVEAMRDASLIVFAGGDGTARDVAAALPEGAAMLGIPCGVKMHSGVFAVSPGAAGALLADLVSAPDRIAWNDAAEVMDIDEDALRAGVLAPRLYGLARVPVARRLMQASKGGPRMDSAEALTAAAQEVAHNMTPGTLYIIGPGTSAGAVMRAAGHAPTTLGTDALLDGAVVARDARASELEALASDRPVRIVLGVTGQQGFLLGRGNQQISPALIARAGREGLIVLATEEKLASLAQPRLWVDTGVPDLDTALSGYIRVRTGAGRLTMMRVGAS